jgi:hypothetical protein
VLLVEPYIVAAMLFIASSHNHIVEQSLETLGIPEVKRATESAQRK